MADKETTRGKRRLRLPSDFAGFNRVLLREIAAAPDGLDRLEISARFADMVVERYKIPRKTLLLWAHDAVAQHVFEMLKTEAAESDGDL